MSSILKVQDLNFKYHTIDVLQNVSFEVNLGDYIGLVGHNGSGKTTLIKVVLGLLKPYSGILTLFGQRLTDFRSWHKVGYMPQNLSLFNPAFPATVEEIVSLGLLAEKKFPKRITKIDKKAVYEVLDRLSITALKDRLIGNLSGGQQQRVFLARALIAKPNLLILDEPSNALDAASREQFFSILTELNKEHETAIILITHDVGQVGKYASKLLYLDRKVIFYGGFSNFCRSDKMTQQFGLDTQHIICHQHD